MTRIEQTLKRLESGEITTKTGVYVLYVDRGGNVPSHEEIVFKKSGGKWKQV